MEEIKKEMNDKFLDYFRNTFFVDRRNLIQSSDENDVDMTYNFNNRQMILRKVYLKKCRMLLSMRSMKNSKYFLIK